jgi:hypothetical protein
MAEIWYVVISFISVPNILGSVFGPIRILLPVCRFCWFLYTFNIHLYMHIFIHIFLSNYWWQRSDIWSQALYRYPISWEAFLDRSDSYFLFADFVECYTHWTYILYMPIFLSNYWWQKSDIWSQASYRYLISWEAFLDLSDSYFLFAEERGYHKWALVHSSSSFTKKDFIWWGFSEEFNLAMNKER